MGYIGTRRSERSQDAIEDYEVPLNHFNKGLIQAFIDENEEYDTLRTKTVRLWKFVATRVGATSWHHTGTYFNETDHYSLEKVADELLRNGIDWEKEYKTCVKQEQEIATSEPIFLSVIKVQIWGGSKKHPKLIGHEVVMGVKKKGWLYAVSNATQSKYKLSANKVEMQKDYSLDDYSALTKVFSEFKAQKRVINKKVKEIYN
ncbi:hypothetical protein GT375_14145 [Listeria monocytogenes]|nr:hypothetical protein [Listeria monocytogenes]